MLLTLVRRYSRPYTPYVIAVVVFQLASTLAALYLPSLNARILDEGVSRGDTEFIWRREDLSLSWLVWVSVLVVVVGLIVVRLMPLFHSMQKKIGENRRIVEQGNHEVLLTAKCAYHRLYMSQFAGAGAGQTVQGNPTAVHS